MKKQIFKFIFIVISFFACNFFVEALTCSYNYTKEDYVLANNAIYKVDELVIEIIDFDLTYTKKNISIKSYTSDSFSTIDFEDIYYQFVSQVTIDDFLDENEEKKYICPDLYYIAEVDFSSGTHTNTITAKASDKGKKLNLISSSGEGDDPQVELEESEWLNVCRYGKNVLKISENNFEFGNVDKAYLHFDENDLKMLNYQCPKFICLETYSYEYYEISEYDRSNQYECYEAIDVAGGCINFTNMYEKYIESFDNKVLNELKQYCSNQFNNNDFDYICVKECLKLASSLPNINFQNYKCGFSGKLRSYIANIIKWLKYIIPVIVIVLGILDFIKAIASEKDDEMKKAQGHFVKRLIAAALIFIIPFIIEFVLNKMGFDANGCGIIDL